MLSKCINCGFYVSSFERRCPNCGLPVSIKKITAGYLQLARKPAFFAILFTAILSIPFTLFLFDYSFDFLQLTVCSVVLFLLFFLTIFWISIKRNGTKSVPKKSFPLSSLTGKQMIVEKRISELSKRIRKIDDILDKINHDDSIHLQQVRQKLLSAREIVIGQFARYELQHQKINLVRLQNSVSPFLFGINRLNETEMNDGITTIETTKSEINRIRQNLTRYDAIDFPPKVLPEKEAFLTQLDETEMSCEKLREVLLSRQAMLALRDISPVEETVRFPVSKELVRETDVFNIQTAITDFTESFDELENEYRRLKSEKEIFET